MPSFAFKWISFLLCELKLIKNETGVVAKQKKKHRALGNVAETTFT